jgi:hypothetical protein
MRLTTIKKINQMLDKGAGSVSFGVDVGKSKSIPGPNGQMIPRNVKGRGREIIFQ